MKNKLFNFIVLVVVIVSFNKLAQGDEAKGVKIEQLINALAKVNPDVVVGYERVNGLKDVIADSVESKISGSLLKEFFSTLEQQTDYRVVMKNKAMIILPKTVKDRLLSEVHVSVTGSETTTVDKIMEQIRKGTPNVQLFTSSWAASQEIYHKAISFPSKDDAELADVLSDLARATGSGGWIVIHGNTAEHPSLKFGKLELIGK